jgi:antitoxin component of MazEF toxin-antitoxin module
MAKVKPLQQIGTSKGIVIDKSILEMLGLDHEAAAVEFEITKEGLLLKPTRIQEVYKKVAKRHRKSLDKLGK